MNKNTVIWVIAVIFVNILWSVIADNEASQTINRPGAEFSYERDVPIESIWGDSPIPVSLECKFDPKKVSDDPIGWELLTDGVVIASWKGISGDTCESWSGELTPGTHSVRTISNNSIESTIVINIYPFETIRIYGHFLFTSLFFLIVGTEVVVKKVVPKKKAESTSEIDNTLLIEERMEYDEHSIWQDPVRPG